MIVLYAGGFHGEFFIGHIVTQTPEYHCSQFYSKSLNKWEYKPFDGVHTEQTDEAIKNYSRKVIGRTHDHYTKRDLPVLYLTSIEKRWIRRAKLLQLLKKTEEYKESPPKHFIPRFLKTYPIDHPPISDNQTTLLIEEWARMTPEAIEIIEDWFEVKYTPNMQQRAREYFGFDDLQLKQYFPHWQQLPDPAIIEEMHRYCDSIGVNVRDLPTFL